MLQIREQSKVLSKVKVVGGDISLPGLGLSPADRAVLVGSVNFIVHCAADIRLEADIQVSSHHQMLWFITEALLRLCLQICSLNMHRKHQQAQ